MARHSPFVLYSVMTFVFGLLNALTGPALPDLAQQADVDPAGLGIIFVLRGIGSMAGALVVGLVLDALHNPHIALVVLLAARAFLRLSRVLSTCVCTHTCTHTRTYMYVHNKLACIHLSMHMSRVCTYGFKYPQRGPHQQGDNKCNKTPWHGTRTPYDPPFPPSRAPFRRRKRSAFVALVRCGSGLAAVGPPPPSVPTPSISAIADGVSTARV